MADPRLILCAIPVNHPRIAKYTAVARKMSRSIGSKSGLAPGRSTCHACCRYRGYVCCIKQRAHMAIIGERICMESGDVNDLRSVPIAGDFDIRTWSEPS
jgi:hypothetical protein